MYKWWKGEEMKMIKERKEEKKGEYVWTSRLIHAETLLPKFLLRGSFTESAPPAQGYLWLFWGHHEVPYEVGENKKPFYMKTVSWEGLILRRTKQNAATLRYLWLLRGCFGGPYGQGYAICPPQT